METKTPRQWYILWSYKRQIIISIQEMTLPNKLRTNGYTWMKKADLKWFDLEDFRDTFADRGRDLVKTYNRKFVSVVYPK